MKFREKFKTLGNINVSDKEWTSTTMNKVSKTVSGLLRRNIKSYTAKRWMATERKLRRR